MNGKATLPPIPLATAADVENAYRLFLGRDPETPAAIADKLGLPLERLLEAFLTSDEFTGVVLASLLRGPPEAGDRFDAPLAPGVSAWAVRYLGLSEAEALELRGVRTWAVSLCVVLRAAGPRQAGVPQPSTLAGLYDAEAMWRSSAAAARLKGGLDRIEVDRVEGWALDALDPDRTLVLQAFVNGVFAGATTPAMFRRDLQSTFGGQGRYGFSLPITAPREVACPGPARVEIVEHTSQRRIAAGDLPLHDQPKLDALTTLVGTLGELRAQLDRIEAQLPSARSAAAFSIQTYDRYWRSFYEPLPDDLRRQTDVASGWETRPLFTIVLLAGAAPFEAMHATLDSLERQSYGRWRMSVATSPFVEAPSPALMDMANACAARRANDPCNTIGPSDVEYIVRVAMGDRLSQDALFQIAHLAQAPDRPLVVYGDEDQASSDADRPVRHHSPRFRAAFDPLLVLQGNDLGGLLAVDAAVAAAGAPPDGVVEPTFDNVLRVTRSVDAARIRHIPRVLRHVGKPPSVDVAELDLRRLAVERALPSYGVRARVQDAEDILGAPLVGSLQIRPSGRQAGLATVIIPTRDRLDLLKPCLDGLAGTRDGNATPFEIIVVDNGSVQPETRGYLDTLGADIGAAVLRREEPFNWARLNNEAAAAANGDVLIFLNDDTLPLARDWCDELCLWAGWPDVAAVGARLVYADGTLQHAGVLGGVWGLAAHEGVGSTGSDGGYLQRHAMTRSALAVTGACLAVRREVFQSLGGFDAQRFAVAYNDIDYCLRARRRGLNVVYAPQAVFHHFESKSRGFDADVPELQRRERELEGARLKAAWRAELANDPTYNAHFERFAPPFSRLAPPL